MLLQTMMLQLTTSNARMIALAISGDFDQYLSKFSEGKYPEASYQNFVKVFSHPTNVGEPEIRDALRWKYGHWNKSHFPESHSLLIRRITTLWPDFVRTLPNQPSSAFTYFHTTFKIRFISSAFLTHLLFPNDVPIIDQHNFRAINHYLGALHPGWTRKATPSNYRDLESLGSFMKEVLRAWRGITDGPPPTERNLDKFLMAYGKSIKPKHATKK